MSRLTGFLCSLLPATVLLTAAWVNPVRACQTTIRQNGFVDKNVRPYIQKRYLVKYIFKTVTPEQKDLCDKIKSFVDNKLQDANFDFSVFSVDSLPPKAQRELAKQKNVPPMPASLLFYGYEPQPWKIWKRLLTRQEIEKLVYSETKKKLPRLLIDNYCVLLFCPGQDKKEAAAARAEIKKFIASGAKPLPELGYDGGFEEDETEKKSSGAGSKLLRLISVLEQNCSCSTMPDQFTTDLILPWSEKLDEEASKKIGAELGEMPWDAEAETNAAGTVVPEENPEPTGKVKYALLEISRKDLERELPGAALIAARNKIGKNESWLGVIYGKGKMFDDLLIGKDLLPAKGKKTATALKATTKTGRTGVKATTKTGRTGVAAVPRPDLKALYFTGGGVALFLLLAGGALVLFSRREG